MSKALFETISEHHAALSNAYAELAAEAVEQTAKAKAKAKAAPAEDDEGEEEEVPPPKAAGTKGKAKAKAAPVEPDEEPDEEEAAPAKKTTAKAKAKAAPVEEEDAEVEYTEDDVIEAAQALIKAVSKEAAVKIIKKHGAARVAELEEAMYPKVIKALKAAMPSDEDTDI